MKGFVIRMTKTLCLYACSALGNLSQGVALLAFKTRRVSIVRRITAWLGVKIALLALYVCGKAVGEESLKVAAKEAPIEVARHLVQRLNEEDLEALRSALDDPENLMALAQKYHLPDMDLFIEALRAEMEKRREATKPGAPLSGP